MAGAEWSEARKFGGSPTLVEEEGLAWWWRDVGTVAERQRKGRLAGVAWPESRRDGSNTTVAAQQGGSRGGVARSCGERRRRQRRRQHNGGSTTVATRELAWWSGRKLQREIEETAHARKKGVRVFEP